MNVPKFKEIYKCLNKCGEITHHISFRVHQDIDMMQISAWLILAGIFQLTAAITIEDASGFQSYIIRFHPLSQKERDEHHAWVEREIFFERESSEKNMIAGSFHFSDDLSGYYGEFTKKEIDLIINSEHIDFVEKEQVVRKVHYIPEEDLLSSSSKKLAKRGNSADDISARDLSDFSSYSPISSDTGGGTGNTLTNSGDYSDNGYNNLGNTASDSFSSPSAFDSGVSPGVDGSSDAYPTNPVGSTSGGSTPGGSLLDNNLSNDEGSSSDSGLSGNSGMSSGGSSNGGDANSDNSMASNKPTSSDTSSSPNDGSSSNSPSSNGDTSTSTSKDGMEVENNAGWPLAVISHKEKTDKNEYVYKKTNFENIIVYVVDSGCDPDHEDYKDNFRNNQDEGLGTEDGVNHATPICAIIGGKKFGVAKGVELVSVKMKPQSANMYSEAAMIEAFQWVLNDYKKSGNQGKKAVVNYSVDPSNSQNFNDAFKAVQKEGIPIVMSGGNLAKNNCQLFSGIIDDDLTVVVASIDSNYNKAQSSNFGPCISVFGPGDNVESASRSDNNNAEGVFLGTSFAAPHVSGLIAYYMSLDSIDARAAVQKVINSNENRVQNPGEGTRNFLAYNGAA